MDVLRNTEGTKVCFSPGLERISEFSWNGSWSISRIIPSFLILPSSRLSLNTSMALVWSIILIHFKRWSPTQFITNHAEWQFYLKWQLHQNYLVKLYRNSWLHLAVRRHWHRREERLFWSDSWSRLAWKISLMGHLAAKSVTVNGWKR